jgi:hypothetical protein
VLLGEVVVLHKGVVAKEMKPGEGGKVSLRTREVSLRMREGGVAAREVVSRSEKVTLLGVSPGEGRIRWILILDK